MGLLSALRPGIRPADLAAAATIGPLAGSPLPVTGPPLQLGSPWQDTSHLAEVVWSDVFGASIPRPVTRAEAMAVPAAARARHVICTTLARVPIRAYRAGQVMAVQPGWLESTRGAMSWYHLKLHSADDLLWYGWTLWHRVNGADSYPLDVARIPWGTWSVDEHAQILWDRGDGYGMRGVDQAEVILVPGPHEGLLTFAQGSIRHAYDLQRAADRAAKHPAAHLVLKQKGGTPLPLESDDPKKLTVPKLVEQWARARDGINGGVGYLPENLDAVELGTFDRHLVLDGRNAAAVDIARHASLPADLLDAAGPTSLTYSNSRDNDRRALDYGIGAYMGSLTARLSQGDVTPLGTRVAFDVEEWLGQTVPGQAPAETPPPVANVVPANVTPITAARS